MSKEAGALLEALIETDLMVMVGEGAWPEAAEAQSVIKELASRGYVIVFAPEQAEKAE